MANRFWVGGGSANTWAATGNTNWSASSNGANNASVPGVSDLCLFDSHSAVGNSVIGANITVQGLDCTGGTGDYAGTITHNTGVTLTINTGAASSLRFSAGMTYTANTVSSIVAFTHTSGTANITSNGKKLFALNINGAGGTTQILDALQVNAGANAILTVTSGIFDANGGAGGPYTVTACKMDFSPNNTRSVILGGTLTLGGNVASGQTILNVANTGTLTFTKNSANVTVLTPNSSIQGVLFTAPLTFNDITLNANSNTTNFNITNSVTFAHMAVGAGWGLNITNGQTLTVSNAFTWTGTAANPIFIGTNSAVAVATISCPSGACSLTWGGVQGITGSGGASFTATNAFNFGTNSGWAFNLPADGTSTGIAAAVWQDAVAGDFTVTGSIGKSLFTAGVVPGAANGLFIAGTNAPVTITGSGNALTLTSTGGNGSGIFATGQGSGDGFTLQGGNSTDGDGIHAIGGTGRSYGFHLVGGGTSGPGLYATGTAGNSPGIEAVGIGTGDGMYLLGGDGTSGDGLQASGGSGASVGIRAEGGGTSGDGIFATATAGNSNGIEAVSTGSGTPIVGNILGNLSGSVGSVTGAVGSVTGNVGGSVASVTGNVGGSVASVTGAVGSVTARVTANTDQIAGNATSASNLADSTANLLRGTVTTGASTTSIPTSAFAVAGVTANQFANRVLIFDPNTATTGLRGTPCAITASTISATPTFTVSTLPAVPASGDTFVVS